VRPPKTQTKEIKTPRGRPEIDLDRKINKVRLERMRAVCISMCDSVNTCVWTVRLYHHHHRQGGFLNFRGGGE
jgi:hypothetical protein